MRKLTFIFILLSIESCAPKQEVREPYIVLKRAVPGIVLEKTIHNIVILVGRDFFESNIGYLGGLGDGELYLTSWEIKIDSLVGANYRILVGADAEGNLKKPIDLPDCRSETSNCRVAIDKDEAIELTKNALEITNEFELVDINFGCGGASSESFVWRVAGRSPKLSREPGATVVINAATGEILEKETWRRYEPPKRIKLPPPATVKSEFD
jgi:hypothetical protein